MNLRCWEVLDLPQIVTDYEGHAGTTCDKDRLLNLLHFPHVNMLYIAGQHVSELYASGGLNTWRVRARWRPLSSSTKQRRIFCLLLGFTATVET